MPESEKLAALGEKFPDKTRKNLSRKLESTKLKLTAEQLLGLGLIISAVVAIVCVVVSVLFQIWMIAALALPASILVFMVFSAWLPRFSAERRAARLDKVLPDALRQLASTLRAGVGVESAFEDVASSKYGDLSLEFTRVVREVDKGRPLGNALQALSDRSRSQLYKRAFSLIIEGIERGAALADVLDAVATDVKEIQAVHRERRSLTTQQVLFLFAVALFAAPFIMGMVVGVTSIQAFAQSGSAASQMFPIAAVYNGIQAFICSLAVGVVRYGKMTKGLGMAIPFAIVATVVFVAATMLVGLMAPAY